MAASTYFRWSHCARKTSKPIVNAISLPVSAFGPLLSETLGFQTMREFGRALAPANLSARQAKEMGLLTSGIFGQHSITSFSIANQSELLGSKLQAQTALLGSTLYKLTWKLRITPLGRSIPALRASARPTSDKDYTGWPTPRAAEAGPDYAITDRPNIGGISLQTASALAGWVTTTTRDWKDSGADIKPREDGTERFDQLPRQANLAGWPTPQARDHFPAHTPEYIAAKKAQGHGMQNLNDYVQMVKPARLTADGKMLTGSSAGMESGGQLNPAHSRWLMGLPPEWDACAGMVTPLTSRKRKGS